MKSQMDHNYLEVGGPSTKIKNKSHLGHLQMQNGRRPKSYRKISSRQAGGKHSQKDSMRNRVKKNSYVNSNITNLLQIIQSSNKIVKNANENSEKSSKLRMVHMDLTFNCQTGQKICLMGRHNSGCSELLLTICGETMITQGK